MFNNRNSYTCGPRQTDAAKKTCSPTSNNGCVCVSCVVVCVLYCTVTGVLPLSVVPVPPRIFDFPNSTDDIWGVTCVSLLGLRSFTSSHCGRIRLDRTGLSISRAKSPSSSFRSRVVLSCVNTRLSSVCQGSSDESSMTSHMTTPFSVVPVW